MSIHYCSRRCSQARRESSWSKERFQKTYNSDKFYKHVQRIVHSLQTERERFFTANATDQEWYTSDYLQHNARWVNSITQEHLISWHSHEEVTHRS